MVLHVKMLAKRQASLAFLGMSLLPEEDHTQDRSNATAAEPSALPAPKSGRLQIAATTTDHHLWDGLAYFGAGPVPRSVPSERISLFSEVGCVPHLEGAHKHRR